MQAIQRYRNQAGGALMIAIGFGAIIEGQTYPFGSLARMGPGFFPVVLGALLGLVGVAISASAKLTQTSKEDTAYKADWRGWGCIALSLALFIILGRYGGLLPATFAVVFVSALGDRRNSVKNAFVLAVAIVAVCVTVFWGLLQLQFPLFTWG
jgi:Tripartite tricarboxylate transporter TctB family